MELPQKQLVLLCILMFLSVHEVLAGKFVLPIERDSSEIKNRISSIEVSNYFCSSPINYTITANILDLNGNLNVSEFRDSLAVCNIDKITLNLSDTDGVISDIAWYNENEEIISNNFTLEIDECENENYNLVLTTAQCTDSIPIKIICTDIEYEIAELVNPESGSGILDFNGDDRLDLCAGDTVSLLVNNLIPSQTISYQWLGLPDFIIEGANTANPKFFGVEVGNYNVLLRIRNQFGCTSQQEISFSVNGIEDLEIQASTVDEFENIVGTETIDSLFYSCSTTSNVLFSHTGVSTNGNVLVEWLDDEGNLLSNQPSISIIPEQDRIYSVQVTDEFGCFEKKQFKVIGNPPNTNILDVDFNGLLEDLDGDGDLDICLDNDNSVFVLNNNLSDTLTYLWTGDVVIADENLSSPTLSFPTAGQYTIDVLVTNQFGCVQEHQIDIDAHEFNFEDEVKYREACLGEAYEFKFTEFNFGFYTWEFTDENGIATYSDNNPTSFTYTTPGAYEVKLIPDTGLICSIDTIVTFIEVENPEGLLNIESDVLSCSDGELIVQFHSVLDTSLVSSDQTWNFNNTTTSFAESPIVTISDSGRYDVELQIQTNDGCIIVATDSFEFDLLQTDFVIDTIVVCFDEANVSLNPNAVDTLEYMWEPNPYFTDLTVSNPIIEADFDYTFELTITQDYGTYSCESKQEIEFIVEPELIPHVTVDGLDQSAVLQNNDSITIYQCEPFVPFKLIGSDEQGIGHQWSSDHEFSDANSLSQIETFSINSLPSSGNIIYYRFEKNSCFSPIITIEIVEIDKPVVTTSFEYEATFDCEPSALTLSADVNLEMDEIAQVFWTGPSGFTSTDLSPEISTTGNENGIYTLTIINNAGCQSLTTLEVVGVIAPNLSDPVIQTSGLQCEGEQYIISIAEQSGSDVTYEWTYPSVSSIEGIGTNALTITNFDEALHLGEYTVQVFKGDCISTIDTFNLEALIQVIGSTAPICQGDFLFLEIDAPFGVSFVWRGPDNFYSEERNPILQNVSNQNNGIYTVVVENTNGCFTSAEITISNILMPNAIPIIQAEGPTCKGDSFTLSTNLVGNSYQWIGPLGIRNDIDELNTLAPVTVIGENSQAYLSGDWRVVITDENSCTSISDPISIAINDIPEANILGDESVCEGGTLKLFAATVTDASYTWYNEDPQTGVTPIANTQNFEILNIEPGFYTYYLSVLVDACPSEIVSKSFLVEDLPITRPSTSYIYNSDCNATELQLEANLNVQSTIEYIWRGPNNFSSTQKSPTIANISEATNGIYFLQVIDQMGCVSLEQSLEVSDPPIIKPSVEIVLEEFPICEGGVLTINSESSNAVSYSWEGPNGLTSVDQNIKIANANLDNNGLYTLTAISSEGCEATANIEVDQVVKSDPSPSLFLEQICTGENLTLESNTISESYTWIPPSGSLSNLQTESNVLQITPQSPYYISGEWSLQVLGECLSGISSTDVNINPLPVVEILEVEDGAICEGGVLTINSESSNSVSYSWEGPNGFTSVDQNIEITNAGLDNNGLYTLIVMSSEGCEATTSIEVDQITESDPSPSIFSERICAGENLILESSTISQSYIWIPPSVELANLQTESNVLQITPLSPYYISGEWSLQVLGASSCPSNLATTIVDISPKLEMPIVQADDEDICAGESVVLQILNPQNQVTYTWTLPDGSIIITNEPELIIEDTQTSIINGSVTVVASNQTCNSEVSAAANILVVSISNLEDQFIEGQMCIAEEIQLSAPSIENTIYEWIGPNNFSSNSQNPILEVSEDIQLNGVYALSITTATGCTFNSTTTVDLEPGIEAPIIDSDIIIYCPGDQITIFTTEYTGDRVEYKWTFPVNSTIENAVTQTNQLVISDADLSDTGFYSVAVFVDGCLSYSSEDLFIMVYELPTVIIQDNYTVCAYPTGEIVLTAEIQNANGSLTYDWAGPLGFFSTEESPVLTDLDPSQSGVYTLIITDESGCSTNSASTTVQINALPDTPVISSSAEHICAGENIELTIQNFSPDAIYTWTLNDGTQLLSDTETLTILEANPSMHDGVYSVIAEVNNCESFSSNELEINVIDLPFSLDISNTTLLSPACQGETVQLLGPDFPRAEYTWLGPNDFISKQQSPILSESSPQESGVYTLYIEIEGCRSKIAETEVQIRSTPPPAAIEDIAIACAQTEVILRVLNPLQELIYNWYRATENVVIATGPVLSIPNVSSIHEGLYQVVAKSATCSSEKSEPKFLRIEDPNSSIAFAGEDMITCTPDYLLGDGTIDDRQGIWTIDDTLTNVAIIDSTIYQTRVTDLSEGDNHFIWTLTDAVCTENLKDTINIFYTPYPVARDDRYILNLDVELVEDVAQNDILNTMDYTINPLVEPMHGSLLLDEDGTFQYSPDLHYFGADQFVYELCNNNCPDDCVEATVFIDIGAEFDCFVPSIFSPNEDGKNDSFIIPFLSQFRESRMTIFNRWGDEVFYSDDYQSEWKGTYKGNSLPAGTYYYILEVNDDAATIKYGYIFLQR